MRLPASVLASCQTALVLAALVQAKQAQYYEKGQNFGFAVTSTTNNDGADVLMQLSAPTSYGWAAAGTGSRMDNSLMFIIYPSGGNDGNDVTLSVRTARGHDTPNQITGVNSSLVKSTIQDGIMTATFQWHQEQKHTYSKVDVAATKQPWIWAVGPNERIESDQGNAEIEQHSSYGVVFIDMSATQNAVATIPAISGTSNISAKGQPGSYHVLVVIHALLLGAAFVIVFPLGVVGLRWKWSISFKIHWILQLIASIGAYIGLGVAIVLSIIGIQYDGFDEAHQIIGICVVALLSCQIGFGYVHHLRFKAIGRRTISSYAHRWLGRLLVYGGMVNAVLGFLLEDSTGLAIACAVVAIIFAIGLEYFALRYYRQSRRKGDLSTSSSNIALTSYDEL